jgi:hypothetical protein
MLGPRVKQGKGGRGSWLEEERELARILTTTWMRAMGGRWCVVDLLRFVLVSFWCFRL